MAKGSKTARGALVSVMAHQEAGRGAPRNPASLHRAGGSGPWCCAVWEDIIRVGPRLRFALGLPLWVINGLEVEVEHCPFCGAMWESYAPDTTARVLWTLLEGGQKIDRIEVSFK